MVSCQHVEDVSRAETGMRLVDGHFPFCFTGTVVLNQGQFCLERSPDNPWTQGWLSQAGEEGAVGIWWVEVRDAANTLQCAGQLSMRRDFGAQHVSRTEIRSSSRSDERSVSSSTSSHTR